MTDPRRIEYADVDTLPEAARNAKGHDDEAIRQSLRRFGFTAPILLDERTGRIVAGHGRRQGVAALRAAGEEPPDGVRVHDGTWLVPVVRGWASTDDDHADAYAVADNRLTEAGGWDDRVLAEILGDLRDVHLLDVTGFTDDDLDALIRDATGDGATGSAALEGDPDDLPDVADGPTISQPGDVWLLGEHRLAVGDSSDPAVVAAVIDGERAGCMWTDPPYGIAYVGKTADAMTIENDETEDGAVDLFRRVASVAGADALRPGAAVYVAHPSGPIAIRFGSVLMDLGWSLRQQLVWVKDVFVMGRADYHRQHEPIWMAYTPAPGGMGRLGRGGPRWYGDDAQTTVFQVPRPKRSDVHPTMKPVALIDAMLRNSVPRGGLVYDPFGGSGSTLIACQALGMRARLVELSAKYADATCLRFQSLTSLTPRRADTGEPVDFASVAADAEASAA